MATRLRSRTCDTARLRPAARDELQFRVPRFDVAGHNRRRVTVGAEEGNCTRQMPRCLLEPPELDRLALGLLLQVRLDARCERKPHADAWHISAER